MEYLFECSIIHDPSKWIEDETEFNNNQQHLRSIKEYESEERGIEEWKQSKDD